GGTGSQSKGDLERADDRSRRIPIFGAFRPYGQQPKVWIVRTAPPDFRPEAPEFVDLPPVGADMGCAGHRDVFLAVGIGKGEADLWKALDFVVFMSALVGEEIDRAFVAAQKSAHRTRMQPAPIPGRQHAEPNQIGRA